MSQHPAQMSSQTQAQHEPPPVQARRGIDALSVLDEALAEFVSRGLVHGLGRTDLVVAHRKLISEAFAR